MKVTTDKQILSNGTLLGDRRSTEVPKRKTDDDLLQETTADLFKHSEGTLPGAVLRLYDSGRSPDEIAGLLNLDPADVVSIVNNSAGAVLHEYGRKMRKKHKKEFKNKKGWFW